MISEAKDLARLIITAEQAGKERRAKLGVQGRYWLIQNADPEEWRRKFLRVCGNEAGRVASP